MMTTKTVGDLATPRRTSRATGRADGDGNAIALVTTIPSVVKILTCGTEARTLSKRAVTRLNIKPFLAAHDLRDLNATLFFVPSISGEWTQFDDGYLSQLRNALHADGEFERIINLCQAIPLYRRSRVPKRPTVSSEVDASFTFVQTLIALVSLSHALEGKILEPRVLDRASYSFRKTQLGGISVTDLEVQTDWIKKGRRGIWAPKTNAGLTDLNALPVPENAVSAARGHTRFDSWLDELEMKPLLNRFIYSDFRYDFDKDIERIWDFDSKLPAGQKLLSDTAMVRAHALKTAKNEEVRAALASSQKLTNAFQSLRSVIGDEAAIKMIDISGLLGLNGAGGSVDGTTLGDAAKTLLKNFPYSVAFQKMWDRQANLYEEDGLNRRINAWYVSNGLMHAKTVLGQELPPFNIWAFPLMPTNSVRFVLRPDFQRDYVEKAMLSGLRALAGRRVSA